jgi:hypothetical protein
MFNTNGRTDAVNDIYYSTAPAGTNAYSNSSVAFGSWPSNFGASTLSAAVFSFYLTGNTTTGPRPPPPPPPAVSITISPSSATIPLDSTFQFVATVTGSPNTAVSWKYSAPAAGVSSAGVVTVPASQGTVTATSVADPTKSASATIIFGQTQTGSSSCPLSSSWVCLDRPGDGSNSEQGIYKPANVTLSSGAALLTVKNSPSATATGTYFAVNEPHGSFINCSGSGNPGSYTCTGTYSAGGIVWTSFNQQYGDFQVRAKLSYSWPTIWLLGANCQSSFVPGPDSIAPCNWDSPGSGEIDIVEGQDINAGSTTVQNHLHETAQNDPACNPRGLSDVTTNFHVYEARVTSSAVTWLIDGVQTCTTSASVADNWFLIINTAVSGINGGNPTNYTYPNSTVVDWVKVCSANCANGIAAAAASNGTFFDDFIGS